MSIKIEQIYPGAATGHGDTADSEFPVGYNADAANLGMTLTRFDSQGNVKV